MEDTTLVILEKWENCQIGEYCGRDLVIISKPNVFGDILLRYNHNNVNIVVGTTFDDIYPALVYENSIRVFTRVVFSDAERTLFALWKRIK